MFSFFRKKVEGRVVETPMGWIPQVLECGNWVAIPENFMDKGNIDCFVSPIYQARYCSHTTESDAKETLNKYLSIKQLLTGK